MAKERRWVVLLVLFVTAFRLFAAVTVELGNDEVYYRMYAGHLHWNYFDHPPMVAWLIRLTTFNLLADYDVLVRMGPIVFAALATWMVYRCGLLLQGPRAGFLAAVLYSASVYTSVIAGTFIMPDSPQVFFWLAALYQLLRLTGEADHRAAGRCLLLFGLFTGLGMLCKVHTVFLWAGLGAYAVFYRPRLLMHPAFYAGIGILLLCFAPVIVWNVQNDFATFSFHGNRVDLASGEARADRMLTFVAGQILYCNPVVFGILIAAMLKIKQIPMLPAHRRLLLLVSLPLIAVATLGSTYRDLLPHWTGPGFIGLMLLAGVFFASRTSAGNRAMPRIFALALGLLCLTILAGSWLVNRYPGTLGSRDEEKLGDGDFTLDLCGWEKLGIDFSRIYRSRHGTAAAADSAVLLCDKWFPAAHLQQYVVSGLPMRLLVCGPVEDIHQYHWVNLQDPPPANAVETYRIIPSNYLSPAESMPALRGAKPLSVDTLVQARGGKPVRKFYVYYFGRIRIDCGAAAP